MNNTILAELICTRINHDIIGNVGAVANAVELLDEGDMDFIDDINKILKTSSFTMSSRLKFFRLAFGMENTTVGSVVDIEEIIKDYLRTIGNVNYGIVLDLDIESLEFYKAVMLLSMIGADLFIKGGKIAITQREDKVELVCSAETPINNEKADGVKAIIHGADIDLAAKYAPIYYLQEILINLNYTIDIKEKESFCLLIKKG